MTVMHCINEDQIFVWVSPHGDKTTIEDAFSRSITVTETFVVVQERTTHILQVTAQVNTLINERRLVKRLTQRLAQPTNK